MRIAFCAYDRPGYLAGGPNTWLRRLLPDLRERGFEVHPLVIHAGEASECPLLAFLEAEGFPVTALARPQSPYVEGQVRWLLSEARRIRPSVFVANLVCPAFYATPWFRRAGIPVVGVFHSDAPFCRAMAKHFFDKELESCFEAAVCVSGKIRRAVAEGNRHQRTVRRIPCGAPLQAAQRMSIPGGTDSELRMLYAGRITQDAKRALDVADAFCEAARAIPQVTGTLVGAGPEEAALRDLLSSSRNPGRVHFLGEAAPEKMGELYAAHEIFVLLSDYEGLPIALIEAMAAGLVPVCLAEESGVAEVLQDEVNGLVVSDRGESFVEAIRRLHEDRELLARLAREARATVEREYSSEINHGRWADLLSELGGKASPRRVRVPLVPKLPPPEPAFGSEDLRRPPLRDVLRRDLRAAWFRFRQAVRPRARLREWGKALGRSSRK